MTNTDLVSVQESVSAMEKIETGLAQLRDRFVGRTYDVTTTAGMTLAKADQAAVREMRFEVERRRKAGKAPLLALGKWADQTAARITAEILKIETPIDEVVTAEEQRKKREKEAKIAAEIARVAQIQRFLDGIREWPVNAAGKSSALVNQMLQTATDYVITDEVFQERTDEAKSVLAASLAALQGIYQSALTHEDAQEQLRRDQEELAQRRREDAERQRVADEERRQREAAAQAERDAEAARVAEANRLERERIAREEAEAKAIRDREAAAQQEELRRQREAIEAEAAESRRIAAERQAALDRQEEVARQERAAEAQRQADAAAELARREEALRPKTTRKTARPSREAIIECVAEKFEVDAAKAQTWLKEIDWESVAA